MRLSVGDVRLFVEVFGQEQVLTDGGMKRRPVLIGLHGGPGQDATTMRHDLAPLSDVAHVVVPDQRGHGRSDPGAPTDWNLSTWAADIHRLCDALEITKPLVLGRSFGGFVAQQYASTYPQDIAGLILVSTAARYPGAQEVITRARKLAGEEVAEALRRDIENPAGEASTEDQQHLAALYQRRPNPEAERLEPHILRTPEIARSWVPEAQRSLDLRPVLRFVQCPTLVLIGEADPLNPPALGAEIIDAIPNDHARLETIPDSAHNVFSDNPEYTRDCVREFIRHAAG